MLHLSSSLHLYASATLSNRASQVITSSCSAPPNGGTCKCTPNACGTAAPTRPMLACFASSPPLPATPLPALLTSLPAAPLPALLAPLPAAAVEGMAAACSCFFF